VPLASAVRPVGKADRSHDGHDGDGDGDGWDGDGWDGDGRDGNVSVHLESCQRWHTDVCHLLTRLAVLVL
jgi:hypothetical protein